MNSFSFCGPLLSSAAASFAAALLMRTSEFVTNVEDFFGEWLIQVYLSHTGEQMILYIDPWKQAYHQPSEVLKRYWGVGEDNVNFPQYIPATLRSSPLANLISLGINISRFDREASGVVEILQNSQRTVSIQVRLVNSMLDLGGTVISDSELFEAEEEMSRLAALDVVASPLAEEDFEGSENIAIYFPGGSSVITKKRSFSSWIQDPSADVTVYRQLVESKYLQESTVCFGSGTFVGCKVDAVISFIRGTNQNSAIPVVVFGDGIQLLHQTGSWKRLLGTMYDNHNIALKKSPQLQGIAVIEVIARVSWASAAQKSDNALSRARSTALKQALEQFKAGNRRRVDEQLLRSVTENIVSIILDSDELIKHEVVEIVAPSGTVSVPHAIRQHLSTLFQFTGDCDDATDDARTVLIDDDLSEY